jgi:predicted thioesterase
LRSAQRGAQAPHAHAQLVKGLVVLAGSRALPVCRHVREALAQHGAHRDGGVGIRAQPEPARLARTSGAGGYHALAMEALKVGLRGSAGLLVGEEHTAPRVGSGRVHVLATPVMINLIEAAALEAIERLLPAGHQSLGTVLNVRHIAATPVGMRVTATAEVIAVEGRTVRFRVEARDERELIGDGTHERVVVNVAKFDQRVQRKSAQ